MTRLALLRHGHTAWNRQGRIQGRTDIPLDDAARDILRDLRLPQPWSDAALWSSPLSRAKETGRLVAKRAPQVSEALTEMDWGTWEGQHSQVLHDDPDAGFQHVEDWGWHFAPPDGESPDMVRARLRLWMDGLNGNNVAICHIGIMRVALAMATGWNFDGPAPFRIGRNRLYVLEKHTQGWRWDDLPVRLIGVDA